MVTKQQGSDRAARARLVASPGGLDAALENGELPARVDVTLSEALVLGLLRQGVRRYVVVLGHGSTELGEVLRVYEEAGAVRTHSVRHEVEAAHAATALRWVTGEKAAVVTSIGPGALQALSGSLTASSNGVGVYHIYGDETTEDEGPNMQQIPRPEQGLFLRLASVMGPAYSLHTPAALPTALRRCLNAVDHPYRASPFFLLLPLNTQPQVIRGLNLRELPSGAPPRLGAAAGDHGAVARRLLDAERVVIKVGGGALGCRAELEALADLVDGVFVMSPVSLGYVPSSHPRQMMVGGSKGSLSGNYAMDHADLLLAVGTRAVCQADCSRTGYPQVRHVVNVNADLDAATHYNDTTALVGDARATLRQLVEAVQQELEAREKTPVAGSPWLRECRARRREWEAVKEARLARPAVFDPVWGREVLTQPAAVRTVARWARRVGAVTFFDAGDVQAVGFQMSEQETPEESFTDGGASYMGFASSAVLATGMSDADWYGVAVTGDGSFTMNPQVLIDGVAHGAQGCVVVLDNRRMAAISSLQIAQYGADHATWDGVPVDYVAWAGAVKGVSAHHGGYTVDSLTEALDMARAQGGLALIHVPVYFGEDEAGGLPSYGRWNVGNWVEDTQARRHEIGL
ncbi:MAG TPA: thiamine pyrophosphate-binding protein [Nocardioides sp.]|uniref:thiamine pyrophosphate-dependent enzyme n=1 Tax=Nocardioides sp. TaxID=35761 RepID=UPI002B8CFA88|nr:thiamine pyrophosphate-dependent enzyme [Nocardioides sp.]HQR25539.1 thiamine pyrophosphate-binding protein [Nocardioides sp.]